LRTILSGLTLGAAALFLAASDARALPPAQFAENFDSSSVDGWHYSCQHTLVSTQSGQALQTSGGGHAIWTAPGDLTDFALQFQYGYQQGLGDVIFRMTDTPNGMECYCLKIEPHGLSLVRRLHAPGQRFPEKNLASVQGALPPQQWHVFTIQAVGGQIDVAISGQKVLSYQDPAPLTTGTCGLGVIANSGAVLYDDVRLVRIASAGGSSSATQGTGAANWP
jgi:hypothetical protein